MREMAAADKAERELAVVAALEAAKGHPRHPDVVQAWTVQFIQFARGSAHHQKTLEDLRVELERAETAYLINKKFRIDVADRLREQVSTYIAVLSNDQRSEAEHARAARLLDELTVILSVADRRLRDQAETLCVRRDVYAKALTAMRDELIGSMETVEESKELWTIVEHTRVQTAKFIQRFLGERALAASGFATPEPEPSEETIAAARDAGFFKVQPAGEPAGEPAVEPP